MCGYGLVVERVLAKDEIGVRFSVPAHFFLKDKTGDKSVDMCIKDSIKDRKKNMRVREEVLESKGIL